MKNTAFLALLLLGILLACDAARDNYKRNDYFWGEIGQRDLLISKETVKKAFIVGLEVTKKYVFKQKDDLNAYTITAIKVTDKMKKNGAKAELTAGGPGSKGATIVFTSVRGHAIKDEVEIYVRP